MDVVLVARAAKRNILLVELFIEVNLSIIASHGWVEIVIYRGVCVDNVGFEHRTDRGELDYEDSDLIILLVLESPETDYLALLLDLPYLRGRRQSGITWVK